MQTFYFIVFYFNLYLSGFNVSMTVKFFHSPWLVVLHPQYNVCIEKHVQDPKFVSLPTILNKFPHPKIYFATVLLSLSILTHCKGHSLSEWFFSPINPKFNIWDLSIFIIQQKLVLFFWTCANLSNNLRLYFGVHSTL